MPPFTSRWFVITMSPFQRLAASSGLGQKTAVTGLVLALHAIGLWALQQDSPPISEPQIISAELIAQFVAPPAPAPLPTPAVTPAEPPKPAVAPPKPQAKPKKADKPLPKATDPTPAQQAPAGSLDTEPTPLPEAPSVAAAEPTPTAPAAPSTSSKPAPAGEEVEMPSSNAAYLNNPSPSYPPISRRMNEQGKVMLRVFVSENGRPENIEIKQSSGFDRLDKAAIAAVQRWRFVPGKRNGAPEGMWNLVPINFVLE